MRSATRRYDDDGDDGDDDDGDGCDDHGGDDHALATPFGCNQERAIP